MDETIIGYIDLDPDPHKALLVATDERFIVAWTWIHRFPLALIPWELLAIFAMHKARKLEKLSPDDILNDDNRNFAIPFSDVVEVKIEGVLSKKMVVTTAETEYRFKFSKAEVRHFEDHVLPYLGDKVPIRWT